MHKYKKSMWSYPVRSFLFCTFSGLAVTFALIALFAVFIYFFMDNCDSVGSFNAVALNSGIFTSALLCGRFRRHHGLIEGIICGILICTVISVFGLFTPDSDGISVEIKRLLLAVCSGGVGGVVGVNTKRPKNL